MSNKEDFKAVLADVTWDRPTPVRRFRLTPELRSRQLRSLRKVERLKRTHK